MFSTRKNGLLALWFYPYILSETTKPPLESPFSLISFSVTSSLFPYSRDLATLKISP